MSNGSGLPNGWVEVRIEDTLIPQSNGKVFQHGWSPQCEKHPSPSPDVWGVLKTTAIQAGAFLDEYNKELPAKLRARPHLEVQVGDMLITCAGPRVRCGVPAFVRTSRPRLIISGKMYRFRGHPDLVEPRFLESFLLSTDAQAAIDAMKTGISDSGLNLTHDRFADLPVKLAPLSEQTRIADRIDELFTDLAAGVAALERVRKKLKRYRSAVLHAAVTGRLTEAWRKEHGPPAESGEQLLERLLVERRRQWEERTLADYQAKGATPPKNWRQRYQEPVDPKVDDLPELPEGWCWASMDQCVSVITSGSRDWSPFYGSGSGTFIMAQNVRMGRLDRSYRQAVDPPVDHRDRRRSQVNLDDLLVTIVGANTGDVCRIEEELPEHYICQSVALMRPVIRPTSPWLEAWFIAPSGAQAQFSKVIYGAGRPHLSFEQLETTCIALPPIGEQKTIVEKAAEYLSDVEAIATEVERGLARASRLRQAVLKAAFAGELVEQNPNDEPASALLERIRADREATEAHSNGRPKRALRKKAAPMKKVTKSAKRKSTKKKARKS